MPWRQVNSILCTKTVIICFYCETLFIKPPKQILLLLGFLMRLLWPAHGTGWPADPSHRRHHKATLMWERIKALIPERANFLLHNTEIRKESSSCRWWRLTWLSWSPSNTRQAVTEQSITQHKQSWDVFHLFNQIFTFPGRKGSTQ